MPDMREEFEAYIADVRARVEARGFMPLGDSVEKWMLHAWQASRTALKVELPKQSIYANSIGDYARGFNAAQAADKEALQQAGIEVKQ